MKRGGLWREPLPGSVFSWLFAALLLFCAVVIARLEPVLLSAPALVLAALFVPILTRRRTALFAGLLVLGALGVLLPHDLATVVAPTMLLSAAALLSGEVGHDHGIGAPVARFLRSPKVRAWRTLVFGSSSVVLSLLATRDALLRSSLPPLWALSVAPLALVALAPSAAVNNPLRVGWAVLPFGAAMFYWGAHQQEKGAELVFQAGFLQTLMAAEWAHEGWAKLRPKPRREDDLGPRPIRIHTGGGVP